MFFWVKRVQAYNKDGWNYMEKLKDLTAEIESGGELESELVVSVDCLLKTGSAECDSGEDLTERLNEILILITGFDVPTQSPTATTPPSSSPTEDPTGRSNFSKRSYYRDLWHSLSHFTYRIPSLSTYSLADRRTHTRSNHHNSPQRSPQHILVSIATGCRSNHPGHPRKPR